MLLGLYYFYLFILFIDVIIGMYKYYQYDEKIKIVLFLIVATFLCEVIATLLSYSTIGRDPIYHFYSVLEVSLTTLFFIKTIELKNYQIKFFLSITIWMVIAFINMYLYQPLNEINSNILIIESFFIILMSLFALYKMLLDESITNIVNYPHFWIWVMFLLLWSGSFFFWGYIRVLMSEKKISIVAFFFQEIINIVVYTGIGLMFWKFPKKNSI